jgi:hypothetical protein
MTVATAASKGGGGAVGGVCTGAIRVPAAASAELIALLADGLADAVQSPKTPVTRTSAPSVWTTMESTLRSWLATGRKAIVRRRT